MVLKRNTSNRRIFLASLFGEISIVLLLYDYNYIVLFISKLLIAILMCIIAFKYQSIKYTLINLSYFYMLSIILGGFLYFLKVSNINYLFSLFLCPMAFILYWYQTKIQKVKYQNYYEVSIYFYNHRHLNVTGYLDTGNQLVDPITNKPVILIDRRLTKGVIQIRTPIYVYYNALNCHNVLECIKPSYVLINNKKYKNVLIGFMNNKISMDGIDCILNPIMMEE